MATLKDVAEAAGVSRATVSRVINGQAGVTPETRTRVLRAIDQLNYRPHPLARGLATKRTRIIGVFVPTTVTRLFLDHFFPPLLQGVVQAAAGRGYNVMLSLFSDEGDRDSYVHSVHNGYMDGAIAVVSALMSDVLLPRLQAEGFPLVTVGRWPAVDAPSVDVDNRAGARTATEHLLRIGYRRLGTITGPRDLPMPQDRCQGFEDVLRSYGIPVDQRLVVEADLTELGGMVAMQRLLEEKPEAVFVQSDTMAIGALKAIRAAGLRVPQDIALVGFDDIPLASLVEPPLTTIRQPIQLLGHMAVELLLDVLENPGNKNAHRQLQLPTELVVRASCGALRTR